jgi:hypothetical protein
VSSRRHDEDTAPAASLTYRCSFFLSRWLETEISPSPTPAAGRSAQRTPQRRARGGRARCGRPRRRPPPRQGAEAQVLEVSAGRESTTTRPPRRLPDSAGEPAATVWVERAGKRSWGAPPRVRRCGLNECSAGAAWASSTRNRPADAVGLRRRDGLGRGGAPRRPGGAPASRSERGGGCAGKVLDEMLVSLLWW